MTRLVASVPVNNTGTGSLIGVTFDNLITTQADTSAMSWRYTRNGAPVMDLTVSGTFSVGYYSISGTLTGMSASLPSAGPVVVIDGMSIPFSGTYDLSYKMSFDYMFGGADLLSGSAGNDVLSGRGGNDTIWGNAGNDAIAGGAGADDMNGNQGNDTLDGGDGNDTVYGGREADVVAGGNNDDLLNGNIGNDTVHGNAGNDTVYGGQNEDVLFGEEGNDLLSGDLGNDTLYGGSGADRFWFRTGNGADVIADFNLLEGDRVLITAGVGYSIGSDRVDGVITLVDGSSIRIVGAAGQVSGDWILAG